jgi:phage FluMu gp28-like protein
MIALVEQWGIHSLVIDATGLGAGLASLLLSKFGADRVVPFTFSRPAKSHLAYQLLALLNDGRLKLYAQQQAPTGIYHECWQQLRRARYRLPAPETLDFYVDPADGHDDFLISLALLTEAAQSLNLPAASTFIRPVQLYHEEGRY